jgi:predicted nucleotidyltransferase component of viral defense system
MNDALETMLARYRPESFADYENALKEIVQELSLLGLWRSKFYEHTSCYGGTALRTFHRLPRFSEDM